jgi:hypothetical protein
LKRICTVCLRESFLHTQWTNLLFLFPNLGYDLFFCSLHFLSNKLNVYNSQLRENLADTLAPAPSLIVAFRWQHEIISLWKRASSQLRKRSLWYVSHYVFSFSYWLWITVPMQETDQSNIQKKNGVPRNKPLFHFVSEKRQ